MSRTDLDPASLAKSLRCMAGDGSIEWCHEPMRASVLLDVADLLDENSELRELVRNVEHYERFGCRGCPHSGSCGAGTLYAEDCAMSLEIERGKRELGIEADA